jgi:hypothetical protein
MYVLVLQVHSNEGSNKRDELITVNIENLRMEAIKELSYLDPSLGDKPSTKLTVYNNKGSFPSNSTKHLN